MIESREFTPNIIFPTEGIGMVAMQPYVNLHCETEPFRWDTTEKIRQIARLERTLLIAKQSDHNIEKTHFTIFPEYSIPGIDGIQRIQETLEHVTWKNGTIVIGGVDGLNRDEYYELCREENSIVSSRNAVEEVPVNQWINCCITWIKDEAGMLKRYIQPKLCPSADEEHIIAHDMYEGKTVNIFEGQLSNGTPFRFFSLICIDWIGTNGSFNGIFSVLDELNSKDDAKPHGKRINMCFVLQNNAKPNHPTFLNNIYNFYTSPHYPFVHRDKAIVAMLNTAGNPKPGPSHEKGFSCLVFSPIFSHIPKPDRPPPSYAVKTKTIRRSDNLLTCREVLFRENGACIHSFRLLHPEFINIAPECRRKLVGPAHVHALDESSASDPRTPGDSVSAIVKWINDKIDDIEPINDVPEGISSSLNESQSNICNLMRHYSISDLYRAIMLSSAEIESTLDVDIWDNNEIESLRTLIFSLSIIASSNEIKIGSQKAHASMAIDNQVIDLIVCYGNTHKNSLDHVINAFPVKKERKLIIISRSKQDLPLTKKDKDIYDTETEITRIGYHNLKNCLNANNETELKEKIKLIFGV